MRFLFLSLLFVVRLYAGDVEQWRKCELDEDCVVEKGLCQKPMAINKKFQAKFCEYISHVSPLMNCMNLVGYDWNRIYTSFCHQGRCQIKVINQTRKTSK